jgi:DNA polymerase-3 subunit beta
MKFIVPQGTLIEALNIAGKCIVSKTVMPILEHYLFRIDGDKLQITGTTMEVFLTTSIDISSNNLKTAICIPANRLRGLIAALADQPLTFEIEEHGVAGTRALNVIVTAGKGRYVIPGGDPDNFPEMTNKSDITFKIKSDILLTGIRKTLFAASSDAARAFYGVQFMFSKNGLILTGTDGHVLSTFTLPVDIDSHKAFIVPPSVLSIIQSIPVYEEIEVIIDDKNIVFQISDDIILKSVLIDNKFPDWESVIPAQNEIEAVVNRAELISVFKRVTHFANQVSHTVRCRIDDKVFALGGSDDDFGQEGTDEVAHTFTGEEIEIGMNGHFSLSCLNKMECEHVYMSFSTPNRAILLREEHADPKEKNNLMLIMPQMLDR